jgi:hypothetical protein
VSLHFSSFSIDRLNIRKKPGSSGPLFELQGGKIFATYAPWLFYQGFMPALLSAHVEVARLDWEGVVFEKILLNAGKKPRAPELPVLIGLGRLSQGKKALTNISGLGRLTGDKFILDEMRGSLCGGTVVAKGESRFAGPTPKVEGHLVFKQIRMDELVRELEMEKKVSLTGIFSGPVDFSLGPDGINGLLGHLDSEGGGRLVIVDNGALNQSLGKSPAANIVVENLEKYDYDIGKVILGKEEESLKAQISLEGAGGRRHLEVYWHQEA